MDNINISFAADKAADSEKRLNDIENFISLLADRIKFCLADINDDVAAKSDGEEEKKLIYQALSDGVGEFTNADKNCEIFNDYENNVASSYYAHAEGYKTTANAPYSHAEGIETTAANTQAHAEGYGTSATGSSSHAENEGCVASGSNSHAEGYYTRAYGEHSHASGNHTVAGREVFALGSYNKTAEDVWLVVGNGWGSGENEFRSDALVLDRAGNLHISGRFIADGGVDGVGYTLPVATADTLGGVMIGDNISVTADGVISVDLSPYLKNTDIADWAKADEKPSYTAEEVGAATAADITAAVNAVSIGGRNIITGTAEAVIGYGGHSKGHWRKYGAAGTIQTVDITDTPISCVSKGIRLTSTDESGQATLGQDNIPLDKDSLYTLSCWIRSNSAEGVPCRLQPFYKSTTDHSGNTQDIIISDEWQYISFTAKFSPQSAGTYSGARIYLQPTAAGNYIEVCGIKLEKGNKPTDWSPAPEDTAADITALSSKQSTLEQTVDGFKATVESTYATNTKVSEVEQKADKISWLVKSGTSASSMTLTSEALKIIANTEIKGDMIVGGIIKSTNYVAEKSGTKLSLSDGSWDSKNFKIDTSGNITINGGKFTSGMVSDGGTFVSITQKLINNVKYMGRLYGNTLSLFNHDDNGTYGDGGLYLSSIDNNGRISTAGSKIDLGILINNGVNFDSVATIEKYCFTMPDRIRIGVTHGAEKYDAFRQLYNATDKLVYAGQEDSAVNMYGKTVSISGTNSITSNRSITVSSDARVKNHISDLPSGSENLFDFLCGKSFFYNGDTSTARNYGFIAQDVLSALQKCGLSTNDFAGFCDINGDGSHYALAYEQFIPIMWEEIKRLRKALSERS